MELIEIRPRSVNKVFLRWYVFITDLTKKNQRFEKRSWRHNKRLKYLIIMHVIKHDKMTDNLQNNIQKTTQNSWKE